ncbi:MAG: MFS transporter [Candidatus Lokiarchaeia archaeon]
MFKSKSLESKCYFNVNYVSYVFIYLVYSSIFVFLNNYFPILFFEVLDINRIILAFIQFLAYSILLLRPAFAAITDKYRINGYQRKYYIIFSGYLLVVIYIFMGFTFSNILIFGVFLFLVFLSSTMLDVSTKSLIIDISPTNVNKKRAFFFITVGDSLGRAFPFFLYFLFINDIYSINSWTILFFCSYVFVLPLLGFLPFINENIQKKSQIIQNLESSTCDNSKKQNPYPNSKILFILLCLFVFFAFSDVIFIYPFFPYMLTKFGINNFNLFNFLLIFYFLLSILTTSIGTFLIKKTKPKKMILILIPVIGIVYILYTTVNFTLFIFLYFIGSALSVITNLNISVFIMKFKKGDRTIYFHLIATFKNLAFFIFIPMGTFLSSIITTESLFIIGAVLLNLSLIPLILIKN